MKSLSRSTESLNWTRKSYKGCIRRISNSNSSIRLSWGCRLPGSSFLGTHKTDHLKILLKRKQTLILYQGRNHGSARVSLNLTTWVHQLVVVRRQKPSNLSRDTAKDSMLLWSEQVIWARWTRTWMQCKRTLPNYSRSPWKSQKLRRWKSANSSQRSDLEAAVDRQAS